MTKVLTGIELPKPRANEGSLIATLRNLEPGECVALLKTVNAGTCRSTPAILPGRKYAVRNVAPELLGISPSDKQYVREGGKVLAVWRIS